MFCLKNVSAQDCVEIKDNIWRPFWTENFDNQSDFDQRWIVDKENDGSSERPIHVPFVSYSIAVNNLADDIYKFAKESNEIVPSKYAEIL